MGEKACEESAGVFEHIEIPSTDVQYAVNEQDKADSLIFIQEKWNPFM